MEIVQVDRHVTALVTPVPVGGLGFLPVNSYVLEIGGARMLVDSCVTQAPGEFVAGVSKVVDPADIRWIWLTHPDRDHTGGLLEILEAAPNARLVTNFTSIGHMLCGAMPIPLDRVQVVNPGDRLVFGETEVVAFRPPLYDNPGTVGFFDPGSGILVSSDCFGAPVGSLEQATAPAAAAIPTQELAERQLIWGSADSPWVHSIDRTMFERSLDEVRQLSPSLVLSTHVPAISDVGSSIDALARLPGSPPAPGPDQAVLDAMLAEMEPASADAPS